MLARDCTSNKKHTIVNHLTTNFFFSWIMNFDITFCYLQKIYICIHAIMHEVAKIVLIIVISISRYMLVILQIETKLNAKGISIYSK
jgi:hypothetical protein